MEECSRRGSNQIMDHKRTGRHTDTQSAATPTISSTPSALDHNTISSTTSKRQSAAHPRMITIRGTSDHHHLESVITIGWNDRSPSLECAGGHLSIGRGGFILWFGHGARLSGYDCEHIKASCIA